MSEAAPPASSFQPAPALAEGRDLSTSADSEQTNGVGAHAPPQSNGNSGVPCAQESIGLPCFSVGWAQSDGNRPHQDDRCVEFVLGLPDGGSAYVWAVADGHHQHHVAELVCAELEGALRQALAASPRLELALRAAIRRLDDVVFARHEEGRLATGGTTLIVHVLTPTHVYTANVGDCKSVLSSRGACVELNTCHNPNVASERDRFQSVGIYCSADHIGGSDINVCRTLGDYDLGLPLKGRDAQGRQLGPLISDPEVCVLPLDELSEFVITASDGLWDYYSPESSVLSDTRRTMRRLEEDPQQVAEWLLDAALQRQAHTLHPGTPGDNVTVMVVRLRRLPPLPRSSGSRLCLLRGGSGDLTSPKMEEASRSAERGTLETLGSQGERHAVLQRRASHPETALRQQSSLGAGDECQPQDAPPLRHSQQNGASHS